MGQGKKNDLSKPFWMGFGWGLFNLKPAMLSFLTTDLSLNGEVKGEGRRIKPATLPLLTAGLSLNGGVKGEGL